MQYPNPTQGPDRDLQGTGPIDAQLRWIGRQPAFPLPRNRFGIEALRVQGPGLGEQDKVLMPVDLPYPLVIADLPENQLRDPPENNRRAFRGMLIIPPPPNFTVRLQPLCKCRQLSSGATPGRCMQLLLIASAANQRTYLSNWRQWQI